MVVCIPVVQRKSSASIVQGLKEANGPGEEKVLTTYQTAVTVLPCKHMPRGKCPRHFPRFVYFFS